MTPRDHEEKISVHNLIYSSEEISGDKPNGLLVNNSNVKKFFSTEIETKPSKFNEVIQKVNFHFCYHNTHRSVRTKVFSSSSLLLSFRQISLILCIWNQRHQFTLTQNY